MLQPDPTLVVQERRVDILSIEQSRTLRSSARDLANRKSGSGRNLPLPGSVYSLAQPGLFELSISIDGQTQRILTSVDAVSEPEGTILQRARTLAELLRGVGPIICDSPTFFGISRSEAKS